MSDALEQFATPWIEQLQPYLPGKPPEEVERELGLTDAIKLASNESPLGPSPRATKAIRDALGGIERYPDGAAYHLRQALSRHLGVAPEMLTIGNGSNDVLDLVTRAFVAPEQEVIYSQYGFVVFEVATQSVGAKRVVIPAQAWGADLDAMAAAITEHTRLVFIANPNNPTGTWVSATDLAGFIDDLPRHVLIVVDEAYVEYAAQPDYQSCINLLPNHPNLIITRTFSKAYGLAGLRVGFSIAHPHLADYMNRVRHPFNTNSLALVAAQAALTDQEHVAQSVVVNQRGMAQLLDAFAQMDLSVIPSAGNFLTIDTGTSGVSVFQSLLRLGIIVRPLTNYGMPQHLRITVGTESDNERVIAGLKHVLTQ